MSNESIMSKEPINYDVEFQTRIENKLNGIFREIINLENRLEAIENKKEVLKAKATIEDSEREIKDIEYKIFIKDRCDYDKIKDFEKGYC